MQEYQGTYQETALDRLIDVRLIERTARKMVAAGMSLTEGVREIQKQMLIEYLKEHHGNVCHCARALGTHRNTVSRQIEEFQLVELARQFRAQHRADTHAQQTIRFEGRLQQPNRRAA
jgi:transcriptional regulator with GAF, ATPase, and Fis domain